MIETTHIKDKENLNKELEIDILKRLEKWQIPILLNMAINLNIPLFLVIYSLELDFFRIYFFKNKNDFGLIGDFNEKTYLAFYNSL